jgi:hypothetical protein
MTTTTIKLDIPIDCQPKYTNLVRISHSPAELVFDFAQLVPYTQTATVISRLIMSPIGAKLFYRALAENLAKYEANFGEINLPPSGALANDLFRSIQPPDNPPEKE